MSLNLSEISKSLLAAKATAGLTFEDIAQRMGRSEVWVASLFFGQAKPDKEDLEKLGEILGGNLLDELTKPFTGLGEDFYPNRAGLWDGGVPHDPFLYRLYEIVAVFGLPIKSIVQEKFKADGIMSAINFTANVEREQHSDGDRVKLIFSGKFLPYSKY